VRREEHDDLVLIDRIGQNPQGLIGYLGGILFCAAWKRNAAGNIAS
jgi:hypothetical protein